MLLHYGNVIEGHRLLFQSKAHIWLPISDSLWSRLYLAPFPRYSTAKEVENHPTLVWTPNRRTLFEFHCETYYAKSWDIFLLFSENHVILTQLCRHNAVVSQTDRQHITTVAELCNTIVTYGKCNASEEFLCLFYLLQLTSSHYSSHLLCSIGIKLRYAFGLGCTGFNFFKSGQGRIWNCKSDQVQILLSCIWHRWVTSS